MQIREKNGLDNWIPAPEWFLFLLNFGYEWSDNPNERKICLISMPCDSPGAGIIALGLLCRDLCQEGQNDTDLHWQRLKKKAIRRCPLRCVRSKSLYYFKKVVDVKKEMGFWVTCRREHNAMTLVHERNSLEWHLAGEPPATQIEGHGLDQNIYYPFINQLLNQNARILPQNLIQGCSTICLDGSHLGKSVTHNMLESISIRLPILDGFKEYNLSDLTTIHGWCNNNSHTVSRIMYFNSKTDQFDRDGFFPKVTISDGAKAFLKIIDKESFSQSDIIAVVDRSADRLVLEALGAKLGDLSQWYEAVQKDMNPSLGITIKILRKR